MAHQTVKNDTAKAQQHSNAFESTREKYLIDDFDIEFDFKTNIKVMPAMRGTFSNFKDACNDIYDMMEDDVNHLNDIYSSIEGMDSSAKF